MKVIGIGGYARCGKDTFVSIAKEILTKNNYRPVRVAFADTLKEEVQGMLKSNDFGLNIHNLSNEEKERVRPLFVFWGCQRRYESEGGLYWVNVVDKYLKNLEAEYLRNGESTDRIVALVSDVRFPNESAWIHDSWDGQVIHIQRWSVRQCRDGYGDDRWAKFYDEAPNAEEAKNDPLIKESADIRMEWEKRIISTPENTTSVTVAGEECSPSDKASIPASGDITKDSYLREKVLKALNSTKFFKHQTIGTLSL